MKHNLYIVWNDENNLGIPIIDEQHRSIISTINTLHHFKTNHKEQKVLDSTLIILNEYTNFHFLTEEDIMKQVEYTALAEHEKLHRDLALQTKSISSKMKSEKNPFEILQFLKNWWLNHICIEDRKYADFILAKKTSM